MSESQHDCDLHLDKLTVCDNTDTSSNDILNDSDPISKNLKIWFLVIICVSGIGSYFCYNNPGALEKQVIDVKNM
jgi:uncharacterized protein (UPF0333 family)